MSNGFVQEYSVSGVKIYQPELWPENSIKNGMIQSRFTKKLHRKM